MTTPFRVSQSKIKTYRKCHFAYHLKYVEKLRRKRVKRPFRFGGMVHDMLEEHINGGDPFEVLDNLSKREGKMFARELEEYGDIIGDTRVIMEAYFNYYKKDGMLYLRRGKQLSEHEFNIEIAPGLILTGKLDAVARTPNKLKWLVEHKSFKNMPNEDHRWRNVQSAAYLRVIEMLGWWDNLAGMCWDYVRSKPPTKPDLLKSGKLSQRSIITLPSVVKTVIKEHGLKEKDYPELMKAAEDNQKAYFQRLFTPINKKVVDKVFTGLVDTAKEIADTHGTKTDMNIDRHCEYCEYEPICRAILTNSDADFVKEREYQHEDEVRNKTKRKLVTSSDEEDEEDDRE